MRANGPRRRAYVPSCPLANWHGGRISEIVSGVLRDAAHAEAACAIGTAQLDTSPGPLDTSTSSAGTAGWS